MEHILDISVEEAAAKLLSIPANQGDENLVLTESSGRVIYEDVFAESMIPHFDRSPYDGYAVRGEDTRAATKENPVQLSITEEIPAGRVPTMEIGPGQAAKILTGAPIPAGANGTIKYENTEFTDKTVSIFSPVRPNSNIVPAGEDICIGDLIAKRGTSITPPLIGVLASLGICTVPVYKKPMIAIISTGDELQKIDEPLRPAKIRNSSYYSLRAILENEGVEVLDGVIVSDKAEDIAEKIRAAAEHSDMVITTGGVSVGDYDMVFSAARALGAEMLFRKVQMKPGSATLGAVYNGKVLLGLSGNPASAFVALYMVGMPLVRKLRGLENIESKKIRVTTAEDFKKPSPQRRFVRGRLEVRDGEAMFLHSANQGNGVLSSLIGCDLLGEIPEGSPPVPAGTKIDAYCLSK